MARIWLLKSADGDGKLAAEKSLKFCYATLGLRLRHRLENQSLVSAPEFPHPADRAVLSLAFWFVVVTVIEVTKDDLAYDQRGWQIGFYLLDNSAVEVRRLLGIF